MHDLRVAGIALGISMILGTTTCDLKTAKDLAKAAFLDPEPTLSKPDNRKPGIEGIISKPEGIPLIRRER